MFLCADVAGQDLDIKWVDWIILYDSRDAPKQYIHRVGKAARSEGTCGWALVVLRLEDLGLLQYLKVAKVPLHEFEFSWCKVADIPLRIQRFGWLVLLYECIRF